jgi:transposase
MSSHEVTEASIQEKYESITPYLNERTRRIWAATEAIALGHGGVSQVARATGLSRTTIYEGMAELEQRDIDLQCETDWDQIRRGGGGRKRLVNQDKTLLEDLLSLVETSTRGDPESPLLWTCKSTPKLAAELQIQGHQVSQQTVWRLLTDLDYSLQSNRKVHEGADEADRDEQFLYIARMVKQFHRRRQPVISVDAKKKELIGEFKTPGKEWHPKGKPIEVNAYDFVDKTLGKALPYGVYDLYLNRGWVSVGIDHDTPQFAVESIRHWWDEMGKSLYPHAYELLITADCGGSNGYRVKLWKLELQHLADSCLSFSPWYE